MSVERPCPAKSGQDMSDNHDTGRQGKFSDFEAKSENNKMGPDWFQFMGPYNEPPMYLNIAPAMPQAHRPVPGDILGIQAFWMDDEAEEEYEAEINWWNAQAEFFVPYFTKKDVVAPGKRQLYPRRNNGLREYRHYWLPQYTIWVRLPQTPERDAAFANWCKRFEFEKPHMGVSWKQQQCQNTFRHPQEYCMGWHGEVETSTDRIPAHAEPFEERRHREYVEIQRERVLLHEAAAKALACREAEEAALAAKKQAEEEERNLWRLAEQQKQEIIEGAKEALLDNLDKFTRKRRTRNAKQKETFFLGQDF
jgi:hypothetical protein